MLPDETTLANTLAFSSTHSLTMSSSKRRRELEKILNSNGARWVCRRPTEQEIVERNQAIIKFEENMPKRPDFPDDQSFYWALKDFRDAQPPDYLYTSDESDGGMLPTPEESVGSPSPSPPPRPPLPPVRDPLKPRRAIAWRLKPRDGVASRTRGGIRKKKRMPWFYEDNFEFYELDDKGVSRVVCDPPCSDKVVSSLTSYLVLSAVFLEYSLSSVRTFSPSILTSYRISEQRKTLRLVLVWKARNLRWRSRYKKSREH